MLEEQSNQDSRKWVSTNFLAEYFDVTPKTIWAWVKQKRLPPPKKIGPNCTRHDLEAIRALEVDFQSISSEDRKSMSRLAANRKDRRAA